jgi:hypothetical protein
MSTFLHHNVPFAPKYTKVRDIGFVTGKEFVGGLLEKAMQIEPVLGLVLKCYELRTRQHKMLSINALRPLKHYLPKDLMSFGRRP